MAVLRLSVLEGAISAEIFAGKILRSLLKSRLRAQPAVPDGDG
jgi:hypothetical protein